MLYSIDSIAELFSLSCEVVDRKYASISFSLEKLLSPDATVTDVVNKTLIKTTKTLINAVNLLFTTRYPNRA